jgi:hypothetical protein
MPNRLAYLGGRVQQNHEDPHMRELYSSLHYFTMEAPGSKGIVHCACEYWN